MSIEIFLSAVSDEFLDYRDQLRHDLTRQNVAVKVQEDFKDLGTVTLDKLDTYIAACDAVVHLVGDMAGSAVKAESVKIIVKKYPDIVDKLPPLRGPLETGLDISCTQWEAWLALYHHKLLMIAKADDRAPRGPRFAPTDASRNAQRAHLERLGAIGRFPGFTFTSPDNLAKQILAGAILDLLVSSYAADSARSRSVAEAFIQEMARRIANDRSLDLEGKKKAVRNAIDIYEIEINGGRTDVNAIIAEANEKARFDVDAIIAEANEKARLLIYSGKIHEAKDTLRKAEDQILGPFREAQEQILKLSGKQKVPLKVFLCHSSKDKIFVRQLYKRLLNDGVDPWLDEERLLPGQEWRKEITKAVRACDMVVVCLSPTSISKEGFVQKEIRDALDVADEKPDGKVYIIPAKLEECEVPERLQRWQWVNLFEESGYDKLLKTLKQAN
jgi:hypothetical protein